MPIRKKSWKLSYTPRITYFDDYGKIHNDFFLILVIDKKFIEK